MKYEMLFLVSVMSLHGMELTELTPLLWKEKNKQPTSQHNIPDNMFSDCKKMYLHIEPNTDLRSIQSYWQITESAHDFDTIFTVLLKACCIKYQSGTTSRIVTVPISIFAANGRP